MQPPPPRLSAVLTVKTPRSGRAFLKGTVRRADVYQFTMARSSDFKRLTCSAEANSLRPRSFSCQVMSKLSRAIGLVTAIFTAKSSIPVVRASDFFSAVEKGRQARPQFRQAADSHLAKLRASTF